MTICRGYTVIVLCEYSVPVNHNGEVSAKWYQFGRADTMVGSVPSVDTRAWIGRQVAPNQVIAPARFVRPIAT